MNTGDNGSAPEEEPLLQDIKRLEARGLTPRQAQVAFWIAQGKTNDEVAIILKTSRHTIPHHVEAILARLQLETRAEIILWPSKRLVGCDGRQGDGKAHGHQTKRIKKTHRKPPDL